MSTERDVVSLLRSWFRSEPDGSVDHVIDAILGEVDATRQRRSTWWPARRPFDMTFIVRLGVAAAVLAMAAAVGYSIYRSVGSSGPPPIPTASNSPTPAQTVPITGCLDVGMSCAGILDAGEHASRLFDPYSEDWTRVVQRPGALTYRTPDGWANADDRTHFYTLLKAESYTEAAPFNCLDCPDGVWIGADPAAATLACTEQPDESVGTSAQELAAWIHAHPGLEVTEGPEISVDGRQTFVLDVVGSESYAEACTDPGLDLRFTPLFAHPGYTYGIRSGDRSRLFLVEIDAERAMLIGIDSFDPDDIEAVIAETEPIIESIRLAVP